MQPGFPPDHDESIPRQDRNHSVHIVMNRHPSSSIRIVQDSMVAVISRVPCCLIGLLLVAGSLPAQDERVDDADGSAHFQELDTDGNGVLTEEELLHEPGELTADELRQRLCVFDLDQNQALSLEEFRTLPNVVARPKRGPLPDPLAAEVQQDVEQALSQLIVPVAAAELTQKWRSQLPETVPLRKELWDYNADGRIDVDEARRGLEIAYGLRRPDGHSARLPNGFVYNGSYFNHLDANRDGRLTREEFTSQHYAGASSAQSIFHVADLNQNDELEFTEIDAAGLFLTDVPQEFLKWDKNHDGSLNVAELQLGESWQRNLAPHMLPAFDRNADGELSLAEFQCCPLGNPLMNWTSLRVDQNRDGQLSLVEFFGESTLCGSGLAAEYFELLDRNQDRQLSLTEFTFSVNHAKLTTAQLLAIYDRDADQQVSLLELFSPPGQPLLKQPGDILIFQHVQLFHSADQDGNGVLSQAEFAATPGLHVAATLEARLRRDLLPKFQLLDQDHNHALTREEYETTASAAELMMNRQDFTIGDFDDSGTLSFVEYACLPSVSGIQLRPAVVDPVLEEVHRVLAEIRPRWQNPSTGRSSRIAPSEAARLLSLSCPSISLADLVGWDLNRDGAYQFPEIQRGLEQWYGVRAATGEWLHRPNGQVFNLRTVRDADRDHNSRLTHEEFLLSYWKHGAEAESDFRRADANQDRQLSLTELLSSDLYWIDTQVEFRRFDIDQNGKISIDELRKRSRPHEQRIAAIVFPAFDTNRDQQLSFREYRLTPLANPVHDYDARRWDVDYDGQLSLMEFHRSPENLRQGLGLSQFFFSRLDQNRDQALTYAEFRFSADLKREPVNVVFQILDTNSDDQLQLAELLARERPRGNSAWARRVSEQRSMEVEDAFLSADINRDRALSLQEFSAERATIRQVVLGLTLQRTPASSTSSANAFGSRWQMLAFIGVNVCLFLGLGWWQFRRRLN